jgi:hypothetical protein
MNFDINEARAIIEAAKKRGAIREAGSNLPPVAAPQAPEARAKEIVLPEWLQNGINAPASDDKPVSPDWR